MEANQFFEKQVRHIQGRAEHYPTSNEALAVQLATQLEEPNLPALLQLISLFGPALIREKAEEALRLYDEAQAQAQPSEYYVKQANTALATGEGKPRTKGG